MQENTKTVAELMAEADHGAPDHQYEPAWLSEWADRTCVRTWRDLITDAGMAKSCGYDVDQPDYYIMRFAFNGQESTIWSASNLRVLEAMDSESGAIVEIHDMFGGTLMLDAKAVPNDVLADFILTADMDYPVIDEGDMSELELEVENECWGRYGRHDFRREIESECEELTDLEFPEISDDQLDEWLYQYREDGTIDTEFETGDSCYWAGMSDAAKMIAKSLAPETEWVEISDDMAEDMQSEEGEFYPLDQRVNSETGKSEALIYAHDFRSGFGQRVCQRCNLLPLGWDAAMNPCQPKLT